MVTKKKISTLELVVFTIIIILSENTFYLIGSDMLKPQGSFHLDDLGLILTIVWMIMVFKNHKDVEIKKYSFKWVVLFVFILVIISSIQSNILYGQPMLLGLRPQRQFMILFLAYFPLVKIYAADKEFYSKLEKVLFVVGGIQIILYCSQYFLIDKFVFLHVPVSQRFGDNRLSFSSNVLTILPFFAVNNIIRKHKIKINVFFLILLLFFNAVVIKGRLSTLALVLSIVTIFIIVRKSLKMKLLLITSGIIIFGVLSLSSSVFQSYIAVFDSNYLANDTNSKIRAEGKKFYLEKLKQSPVLGRGYINILFDNASKNAGFDKKYFLIDNGVVAFYFLYGLIGAAWISIYLIKFYKYSILNYFKGYNYIFLGFAIYSTILLPNILYLYWYWGPFYMSILMALAEVNCTQYKLERGKTIEKL